MARQFVGGYGVGARVIMERMKPGASIPSGPDNIFGIGTGPLTLSGVYSTCRFATMGKSPLTGYWGDANSGGDFANALKASGYDIVFFEGKAEHPVYLLIDDGKVEIKDARRSVGQRHRRHRRTDPARRTATRSSRWRPSARPGSGSRASRR